MNKKVIYYLVVIAVLGIGLGLTVIFFSGGMVFSETNQNYDINITEVRGIDGINQISVDNTSADIVIIPENRDNIKVRYYGNVSNTSDIPEMSIARNGEELIIRVEKQENKFRFFYSTNLTLEIHLPEEYTNNMSIASASGNIELEGRLKLQDFYLDSISGNLDIKDLTTRDTKIKLKSGNLKAENLQVDEINVDILSGNMNLGNFKAVDCNLNLTSGNIKTETFHTERTEFHINSGDVEIEDFQGDLNGETKSGNIIIDFNILNSNIRLTSTSGDIVLDFPDDSSFTIEAKTSGDIYYKFPVSIKGVIEEDYLSGSINNGENAININVSSGNITIK